MREQLIEQLRNYQGQDEEMRFIPEFFNLMGTYENCFYRDCLDTGHITGSGLLINQSRDKVLLNHHKIFDTWLSFGGHADGEENIVSVALREAIEESGIEDIRFVRQGIFDVDIHPVPENLAKKEKAHFHYDILFLLEAQTEQFHLSDESVDLRWCTYEDAKTLVQNDKRMNRVLDKWHHLAGKA